MSDFKFTPDKVQPNQQNKSDFQFTPDKNQPDFSKASGTDLITDKGLNSDPYSKAGLIISKAEGSSFNPLHMGMRFGKKLKQSADRFEQEAGEGLRDKVGYALTHFNDSTAEIAKAGARNLLETTKRGTGGYMQIAADALRDNRNIENLVLSERLKAKRNNALADILQNTGKTLSDLADQGIESELLKPDEEIFRGEFEENPSFTRALAGATSVIGSLLFGWAAKATTGSTTFAAAFASGIDAQDLYFEAKDAGKSVKEAQTIYGIGTAGTAVLEKISFDKVLNTKVASLGKQITASIVTEGLTEGGQQMYQNLVKKVGYDSAQEIRQGAVEAIICGAIGGGTMSASLGTYERLVAKGEENGLSKSEVDEVIMSAQKEIVDKAELVDAELQKNFDKSYKTLSQLVAEGKNDPETQKAIQTKKELDEGYEKYYNTLKEFMPEVQAKSSAALIRNGALWAADAHGVSVKEYFEQFAPHIEKGDKLLSGNEQYQFGSIHALTADLNKLNLAKEAISKGEDAEQVRKDTGWFTGDDGKWRFEISDKDAKLIDESLALAKSDKKSHKLKDIFKHDKAYAAYPDLGDVEVVFDIAGRKGGYFDGRRVHVSDAYEGEELREILLHEMQHFIQKMEYFARGGDPKSFESRSIKEKAIKVSNNNKQNIRLALSSEMLKDKITDDALRSDILSYYDLMEEAFFDDTKTDEEIIAIQDEASAEVKKLLDKAGVSEEEVLRAIAKAERIIPDGVTRADEFTADQIYQMLAGEHEARIVQERKDLSDEERREISPMSDDYYTFMNGDEYNKSNTIVLFEDQIPNIGISKPVRQFLSLARENERLDDIYPEYKGETIDINGEQKTVYNSEGKRIAKSAEALRNFYKWFGDSKVVDEQGRPKVMYHGTPNADFTELREGTYFTDMEWYAQIYKNQGASSFGYKKEARKPDVYSVYLKMEKPFDTRNKKERDIFNKYFYQQWGTGTPLQDKGLPDWNDGSDLKDFLEEHSDWGYDGILLDEGGLPDGNGGVKSRGISYVSMNRNQIKSTDNRGTYSTKEDNIYYQEARKDAERNLAVYHNLSEGALRSAIELGGFPSPSLAIVKKTEPYGNDFGDITLVGNKNMIDPRNSTDVFNRDVWTKTFPIEDYKTPSSAKRDAFANKYNKIADEINDHSAMSSLLYSAQNGNASEVIRTFEGSNTAKYIYVTEVLGKKVNIKPKDHSKKYLTFGNEPIDTKFAEDMKPLLNDFRYERDKDKVKEVLKSWFSRKKYSDDPKRRKLEETLDQDLIEEDLSFNLVDHLIHRTRLYFREKGQKTIDPYEVRDLLESKIKDMQAFYAWSKETVQKDLLGEPMVEVGGKLVPWTLHNITENMIEGATKNGQDSWLYGSGKVIAAGAKKLNSIDEIKLEGKKLVSSEESEAAINELNEDMFAFTDAFAEGYSFEEGQHRKEDAYRALGDTANKKNPKESDLRYYLNKELYERKDYPDDLIKAGMEIVKSVKNLSRYYFEAKPQRAVYLDDFSGAIVPTDKKYNAIARDLRATGLKVVRSDNKTEVIDKFKDALFQEAYAGSRVDYDKPSLEAMGSGEHNQAHGWGLYYAASKSIAEGYRKKFIKGDGTSSSKYTYDGKDINYDITDSSTPENRVWFKIFQDSRYADIKKEFPSRIKKLKETYQDELESLKRMKELGDLPNGYIDAMSQRYNEDIEFIKTLDAKKFQKKKGQVHKVSIPEMPELLDEQKTFEEQSDYVKERLSRLSVFDESKLRKLAGDNTWGNTETFKTYYGKRAMRYGKDAVLRELKEDSQKREDVIEFIENLDFKDIAPDFSGKTGKQIYEFISDSLNSDKNASEALDSVGIKGITYVGRQDGRCFVIFNDNNVEVIEKYYQDLMQGENNPRGAYANRTIYLFERADASTLPHELAHAWEDDIRSLNTPKAQAMLKVVDDWATGEFDRLYNIQERSNGYAVVDKKGLVVYDKNGRGFQSEAGARDYARNELFAQGFETYLKEGKSPNKSLKQVFRNFFMWLKKIYRDAMSLDIQLSPAIKNVYADLLGGTDIDFFLESDIDQFMEARIALGDEKYKYLDEVIDNAIAHKDTLVKSEKKGKGFREIWDNAMVPLSTRAARINPTLRNKLRRYEFELLNSTNGRYRRIKPFLDIWKNMDEDDAIAFDLALKNDYVEKQDEIVKKYNAEKEWAMVKNELQDIFDQAIEAGIDVGYRQDYFPRKVKNYEGLMSYYRGTEEWTAFEEALRKADPKNEFTEDEKAEFLNKYLKGTIKINPASYKYGSEKERKIDIVDNNINPFYADSMEALVQYVEGMNARIVNSRFFGKDVNNLDESIGGYVQYLLDNGLIADNQVDEVRDILKSRFGQRGVHNRWLANARNLSYMYTMGGINSAITQIEDLSVAMYKAGVWNTLTTVFKDKPITRQDIGVESVAAEFMESGRTAEMLNKLFKLTGLDAIDGLGKETLINAELKKFQDMAKKDSAKLKALIEPIMEEETSKTMNDIENGVLSDNVLYLLFSELSDVQPVSLSELPAYYNEGGNLRILYMLKSFMVKRIDTFRNECFDKIRSNDRATRIEGIQNLMKLALLMIFCGATKDKLIDLIYNRKTDLTETMINNILGLFGISKFHIYKAKEQGFTGIIKEFAVPPIFSFFDDLMTDMFKVSQGKREIKDMEVLKGIPLVGRFYYWHIGRGRTKEENKSRKKRRL